MKASFWIGTVLSVLGVATVVTLQAEGWQPQLGPVGLTIVALVGCMTICAGTLAMMFRRAAAAAALAGR